jgi:hypothetical protein
MWRNAHITIFPRAPTQLLEFQPRLHQQDATVSSDSARDQASLVSSARIPLCASAVIGSAVQIHKVN